jgi:hypothetical protein
MVDFETAILVREKSPHPLCLGSAAIIACMLALLLLLRLFRTYTPGTTPLHYHSPLPPS